MTATASPPNRTQSKRIRPSSDALLNEEQIVGIKRRLRLSPAQAEHWPAVEEALREVAYNHLQPRGVRRGKAPKIDLASPDVQRLVEVSVQLIRLLSDGQKREVRALVRMIGLEKVAVHI